VNGAAAASLHPERRYVFLASNSYSGSTLLSYLVGTHPQIATVSDVSGTRRRGEMDSFRCSCGNLMRECAFWKDVNEEAKRRGLDGFELGDFRLGFDHAGFPWFARLHARSLRWTRLEQLRDTALGPLGMTRAMRQMGRRNWEFAEIVLDLIGGDVFLDASKERMRIRHLARYLPNDVAVIHLTRDVRGVVDSTLRRGKKRLPAPVVAMHWARTNAAIVRQLSDIPSDRQIRVRYEDLCRDPEGTLRGIFEFCSVDPDPATRRPDLEMHLLGNKVRLGRLDEVRLDESWRGRLGARVQDEVLVAAGPVFRLLYPERDAT
jgi:hypothetical protein